MIRVINVMTPDPITVRPSDTIQVAEGLMDEYRIRQLPVVEGTGLVGIITDRDIRSFLSGRLFGRPEEREKAMSTEVASVMSLKPITVEPDDELRDVIENLLEAKVGGIPVVDNENKLVGIVTYVDVLRCFLERLEEGGA